MTLASGCGNKTLIRIGGGNIKSILVFIIIAVIAYYMTNPFPGSDKTLFSVLFYDWIRPLAISLDTNQDLGSLINSENPVGTRLIVSGILTALLLFYIVKSKYFWSSSDYWLGGLIVGLAILAGWYLSGSVMVDAPDEETQYSLVEYYENWDMVSESEEGKPAQGAPLSPQSFTCLLYTSPSPRDY